MPDQIQGRDTTIRVYVNGSLVRGIPATKFEWEAKQDVRERDLLGEQRETTQLLIHGYKGTLDLDVDSPRRHEIIQFLNESDKAGLPNYELAIQVRENYRDGTSKSYRFVRCTFMIPKTSSPARKEDLTATLEWHAQDIVYLN